MTKSTAMERQDLCCASYNYLMNDSVAESQINAKLFFPKVIVYNTIFTLLFFLLLLFNTFFFSCFFHFISSQNVPFPFLPQFLPSLLSCFLLHFSSPSSFHFLTFSFLSDFLPYAFLPISINSSSSCLSLHLLVFLPFPSRPSLSISYPSTESLRQKGTSAGQDLPTSSRL